MRDRPSRADVARSYIITQYVRVCVFQLRFSKTNIPYNTARGRRAMKSHRVRRATSVFRPIIDDRKLNESRQIIIIIIIIIIIVSGRGMQSSFTYDSIFFFLFRSTIKSARILYTTATSQTIIIILQYFAYIMDDLTLITILGATFSKYEPSCFGNKKLRVTPKSCWGFRRTFSYGTYVFMIVSACVL
jgi:hypothetical protein